MKKYVWCEDFKSGYQFWQVLFNTIYPNIIVETKKNNSRLNTAVSKIDTDDNKVREIDSYEELKEWWTDEN